MESVSAFGLLYTHTSVRDLMALQYNLPKPIIVVTPNIDHVVRCQRSSAIQKLYTKADICVNDSRVLSKLLGIFTGIRLTTVTGSDITLQLFEHGDIHQQHIAVIGSDSHQIAKLSARFFVNKQVKIAHFEPSMGFCHKDTEMLEIEKFVSDSQADWIFLALGSPQQEILAHRLKPKLSKGIILCIGASIDYLTGKERRAPIWVQRLCLEWLFRFCQSPSKRFKRYFIDCPAIFKLLWKERRKVISKARNV